MICYLLMVLWGVGLVFNFIISLIRWDLSPWWWWPAGIGVLIALQAMAANLIGDG